MPSTSRIGRFLPVRPVAPVQSRARSRALALCCAASSLLLAGCGQIPTDGPVYHYADGTPSSSASAPAYSPAGPEDGQSPEEILRGFVRAGTGVADDYSVARKFLTTELAGTWKPEGRTLVYQDDLDVGRDSTAETYRVRAQVSTSVDERGIATSYESPEARTVQAEFRKVNGQWRISAIPDGTLLARKEFDHLFRPYSLYFYDPTYTYAVPDVRWLAQRPKVSTDLVEILLQGPAPYLQDAVVSPMPKETRLQRSSVPVSNRTAEVSLEGDGVSHPDPLTVDRMNDQLQQTLRSLGTVNDVSIRVGDKQLETGQSEGFRSPQTDPKDPGQQIGVLGDQLATYSDGQTTPVQGLPALGTAPVDPAMDARMDTFAYLDGSRRTLYVRSKKGLHHQVDLPGTATRPSVDPQTWVWTATGDGAVSVVDGTEEEAALHGVAADWLAGEQVKSLRVSRDGTRALVVTGTADHAQVWVSGIHRNGQGRPVSLGKPLHIGTSLVPSQAEWNSDSSVVVVDAQESSVNKVSLSGEVTVYNGLSGIQSISSGSGDGSIFAQTQEDTFLLSGTSWTRASTRIKDLAAAG